VDGNTLYINPAYEIRKGKSDCGHKTEKIVLNGIIYEFSDLLPALKGEGSP